MTHHDLHAAGADARPGAMTPAEFAALGVDNLAYVKAETGDDGQTVFVIHAADGDRIGVAPRRDLAFAAVRQHDMEPASVH